MSTDEELIQAATGGDFMRIVDALQRGASVLAGDENNSTALWLAAQFGHVQIVDLLLAHGADPYQESEFRHTPLTISSEYGKTEVVKRLLAAGSGVDHTTVHDMTPLMLASWRGHASIADMLLEAGADVNHMSKKCDNASALMFAVGHRHIELVKKLIAAGANVNQENHTIMTPMRAAVRCGRRQISCLLAKVGVDVVILDDIEFTLRREVEYRRRMRLAYKMGRRNELRK